ncbi:AAA family ATPase [Streptomyces ossamyceticus]|nr:AAA family ATPase [Streptomyces ossamyceticus]
MFHGLSSDNGRVVLVSGTLGSGKTQLLHEFSRQASDAGALVLHATASRAERDLQMGVTEQLFRCADLPNELAEEIPRLISEALSPPRQGAGYRSELGQPVENETIRRICNTLLGACEGRSVVVAIDDVHFADAASLQVLLYLQRRMHPRRMLMVLNEWDRPQPTLPLFRTEITRVPHSRIQLKLMSERAIGTILERTAHHPRDPQLASTIHRLSGGNPILAHALIEDHHLEASDGGGARTGASAVGKSFEMAVLACLYRWEPQILCVAIGIAVLQKHASPVLLSRLLDLDQREVTQAIEILTHAGLAHDNEFRHPEVATVVLASLSREDQTQLFSRAAKLLRDLGMATTDIAAQIVAAGEADSDWTVPILTDAAELELAAGKTSTARLYLNLALAAATDDDQHLATLRTFFRYTWQMNPSAVAPHTATLREALAEGRLTGKDIVALIRTLLWRGDMAAVSAVLSEAKRSEVTLSHREGSELLLVFHWFFGPSFTRSWNLNDLCRGTDARTAGTRTETEPIDVFSRVWARGGDDESTTVAEDVLSACRVDDMPLETITASILVLAHGDHPGRALLWCDELIEHAGRRGATTWLAQLKATRADVCLRDGDPETAAQLAEEALSLAGDENWGVAIGYPLSILIQADIALGRMDAADREARRAVPSAMFETMIGIRYLHARGRLALAAGRTTEALEDLRTCARRSRVWRLDVPTLIPLTISLVEATFQAGESESARDMARSHLEEPALDPRTRGVLLRILADNDAAQERAALLRESIRCLRASGDRVELARAEAELLRVHAELSTCPPPPENDESRFADELGTSEIVPTPSVVTHLSRAELRVAELAAQGDSNREISDKLWITVSTVEQHLTRIYRKLNLTGRAGLTSLLHADMFAADPDVLPPPDTDPAHPRPEADHPAAEMAGRGS